MPFFELLTNVTSVIIFLDKLFLWPKNQVKGIEKSIDNSLFIITFETLFNFVH